MKTSKNPRRTPPPKTIDEYLDRLPEGERKALEKLRRTIRALAPEAEECISYQICAFRQNGMLVGFGATPKHCAFYLMSGTTIAKYRADLERFDTSRGTIRFDANHPLPSVLVRKLVKARLVENEARMAE